jgi:predicted nucleic acid-binding protein
MGALADTLARLQGQRVYFDSNALIYFFDQREPFFSVVAPLLVACDEGKIAGFTGDAAIGEVMVHPYRINAPEAIARGKALFTREGFLTVRPHDARLCDLAAQVRARSGLRLIDALHYATAVDAGCRYLVTNDVDFSKVEGIEVISIRSLLASTGQS